MLLVPPLMWAGNAVVGRMVSDLISPMLLNFIRWVVAFFILLPMAYPLLKPGSALWSHWKRFTLIGLLGVGCYNALQYLALHTSTPLNVTLVAASNPIMMLGTGWLLFGQRVSRRQLLGAALSVAGVLVVLSRGQWAHLAAIKFVPGDLYVLLATLAWTWLVKWRAGAHRAAIWKSLVLPAGGATLCWLLLMTLWLPLLDYARSYAPLSRQIAKLVDQNACVEIYGIGSAQAAAFQYHGQLELRQATNQAVCPYLIVDADAQSSLSNRVNLPDWAFMATVRRPTDKNENILLFKRVSVDAKGNSSPGNTRTP